MTPTPPCDAVECVWGGYGSTFKRDTKLAPWQWAKRHARIFNSERSEKFDPDQTPWLLAPLERAADSETRQVVFIAPTGSGKSTLAEALIPYVVAEDPGNFLYASQTDPDASFWAETRLLPTLRACDPIKGLWPEDRHKSRKLEIIFPHMALVLGGANLSNFQEKSCRWLYGDEVWRWNPGLVREFLARHHNRWNRKVFLVSQGGFVGSELDLEWKKTPQCEFSWRCEKCGSAQEYSFDSLRFDRIERDGGVIDEEATARTARMECIECRAQYADNVQNRRRLASSNLGNGHRGYIARNEYALTGHAGYHVDSLAVWWIPWADEVLGWLEAQRVLKTGVIDKYMQWWTKRRAKFWSDDQADTKVEIQRSDFTKLDHEDGKPIAGEAHRFLTVDVGGDHFWCIVQAWRQGGSSRILYEGWVPAEGDRGAAIDRIAKKYNVSPNHVLIDIGFEQDAIFDLMAKYGWLGVKGEGTKRSWPAIMQNGQKVERLFSQVQRARSKSGPIVKFVFLATNPIKDIAHRILTGNGARLELPADLSKVFENHCRAERREMVRAAKTGQEQSVWVTRNRQNHLWDCLVYQVGAALICRIFDGGSDGE